MLSAVFFYLLPPIGLACNFLFIIEKGRKEYFGETDGYEPMPVWVYIVGSLLTTAVYHLLLLFTDIHLGVLSIIISGLVYVGVFIYSLLFAETEYQIKAWLNMAILSVFSITYGLSSVVNGPGPWLVCLILALIAFIVAILSRMLVKKGHKVRVSVPVRSEMTHENVFFTPQSVTTAIIVVTTVAIILIILL